MSYFPYALGGAALGYAAARRGRGRLAYKFPPKPKPWVSPHMEQLREDLYAAGVPRSTDIRIEAYPPGHGLEGFKVEMVDESAEGNRQSAPGPRTPLWMRMKKLGYFRATRVNEKGHEWNQAPRECYDALQRLHRKQPHIKGVWVVPGAELFDPRLRGKGIGRVMYRHALEAADRAGAALMPHECLGGGTTSPAAKKAWKALPGASEGMLHYLPRGKGRANHRGRGRRVEHDDWEWKKVKGSFPREQVTGPWGTKTMRVTRVGLERTNSDVGAHLMKELTHRQIGRVQHQRVSYYGSATVGLRPSRPCRGLYGEKALISDLRPLS